MPVTLATDNLSERFMKTKKKINSIKYKARGLNVLIRNCNLNFFFDLISKTLQLGMRLKVIDAKSRI